MKKFKISVLILVLFTFFAVSMVEAVGFVLSTHSLRPLLLGPVGEVETATPKLQWKMDWIKESNPQPSPAPVHRMEFRVILFVNESPIWESPRPVQAISGSRTYELQIPAGVLAPGRKYAWQVIAQTYNDGEASNRLISEMKAFSVRGGCKLPAQTLNRGKTYSPLPGTVISAFAKNDPRLMLAQGTTDGQGKTVLNFAICPVNNQTGLAQILGAVTWRAEKAAYRLLTVNFQGHNQSLLVLMQPAQ